MSEIVFSRARLRFGALALAVALSMSAGVALAARSERSDYSAADGGVAQTRPVGLKKPNAYGLYDMHGNVLEMCLDMYKVNIDVSGTGDPIVDPVGGLNPGDNPTRTTRGGCYYRGQRYARSAYRENYWMQSNINPFVGFRVVCPAAADWK